MRTQIMIAAKQALSRCAERLVRLTHEAALCACTGWIRSLDVSGNCLGEKGGAVLVSALIHLMRARVLVIGGLRERANSNKLTMWRVCVRVCACGTGGLCSSIEQHHLFGENHRIKEQCGFRDESPHLVSHTCVLLICCLLDVQNVSSCSLGSRGVALLVDGLSSCSASVLRSLDLRANIKSAAADEHCAVSCHCRLKPIDRERAMAEK